MTAGISKKLLLSVKIVWFLLHPGTPKEMPGTIAKKARWWWVWPITPRAREVEGGGEGKSSSLYKFYKTLQLTLHLTLTVTTTHPVLNMAVWGELSPLWDPLKLWRVAVDSSSEIVLNCKLLSSKFLFIPFMSPKKGVWTVFVCCIHNNCVNDINNQMYLDNWNIIYNNQYLLSATCSNLFNCRCEWIVRLKYDQFLIQWEMQH